jgi:DNA-binding MarR family transcriptional regulator
MSTAVETRGPFIGSMMRTTVRWILDHVYDHVVAAGFDDLGRAHVRVFRYPSAEGLRPSELADRLEVTKQSVNDLLHDLEERGYLTREPDPSDGRARVVRLTKKGHALEDATYAGAASAQQAIADVLGPRRFPQFRDALAEVSSRIAAGELDDISS